MIVTLERLKHSDINLLRELRNANADAFFDDTHITREMQEDWWWRSEMADQYHQTDFYTIYLNTVIPVGFLSVKTIRRFKVFAYSETTPAFEVREIGNLLLAPAFRRQGIMHAALIEVRRLYDPLTFWIAHVKPTNAASLKVFAAQGFVQLERTTSRKPTKRRTA